MSGIRIQVGLSVSLRLTDLVIIRLVPLAGARHARRCCSVQPGGAGSTRGKLGMATRFKLGIDIDCSGTEDNKSQKGKRAVRVCQHGQASGVTNTSQTNCQKAQYSPEKNREAQGNNKQQMGVAEAVQKGTTVDSEKGIGKACYGVGYSSGSTRAVVSRVILQSRNTEKVLLESSQSPWCHVAEVETLTEQQRHRLVGIDFKLRSISAHMNLIFSLNPTIRYQHFPHLRKPNICVPLTPAGQNTPLYGTHPQHNITDARARKLGCQTVDPA
ncbi:hypothetical protein JOM56_000010 [Amanita muscaria]